MILQFLNGDLWNLPEIGITPWKLLRRRLRRHASALYERICTECHVPIDRIRLILPEEKAGKAGKAGKEKDENDAKEKDEKDGMARNEEETPRVFVFFLDRPCVKLYEWFPRLDMRRKVLRECTNEFAAEIRSTRNESLLRYLLHLDARRMMSNDIRRRLYQNPHDLVADHLLTPHPIHPHRLLHVGRRARGMMRRNPHPRVREWFGWDGDAVSSPFSEKRMEDELRQQRIRMECEWEWNARVSNPRLVNLADSSSEVHVEWLLRHAHLFASLTEFSENEHPLVVKYLLAHPEHIQFPRFLQNSHPDAVAYSIDWLKKNFNILEDTFNQNPTLCTLYRNAVRKNRNVDMFFFIQNGGCPYVAHDDPLEMLSHLARIPEMEVVVERSNLFV